MSTAEAICPTSGLPCETANRVDKTMPFNGCPGQIAVIVFNSIEKGTASDDSGGLKDVYDVGSRVQPFIVCGINALEQAVSRNVTDVSLSGEKSAAVNLNQVRQAAADLILNFWDLPQDTVGLHASLLGSPEEGANIVALDDETLEYLLEGSNG